MMWAAVVWLAVVVLVRGDGYWDIQLSPQSVASVPFGPGHISVWQHATTKGRYYAMPLVYLLHNTAKTKSNIVTRIEEMSFQVLMWSLEAKEAVYRHLKRDFDPQISQDHIEMLPMEKIRIIWSDRIRPIAPEFKLVDHWKSNTDLPSVVTFQFTCDNRANCQELMTAMKESPEFFNALEMEYVINGQRSARRELSVTGRHLTQGRLWTKLTNMNGGTTRYITSDDLKTITSESVTNVLGSVQTDSDYVDTGDEVNLKDIVQNILSRDEESSTNFQPHMWDSVFWDPTWARPDKLTSYLNHVLEKDTKDSKYFILNEGERSSSHEGSAGGDFLGMVSVKGSSGGSSSSKSKVQKEELLNTLRERHNNIEWTGEKFRVKPMKLYRLNLSTLNISNNIATASVQVRRYESVHTIKLRLPDQTKQTSSLTPQLVMARLTEKIDRGNAESKRRFDETITKSLGPIQQKLATLPGWAGGSYCILANGGCPAGFSTHSGRIHGILTPLAGGGIGAVNFGSSSIGVRDVPRQGKRSLKSILGQLKQQAADLNLVACCK